MAKFVADIQIELELDGDEEMAFKVIDETLQRAWDTDQGRAWITQKWHFMMTEGSVTKQEWPEELTTDLQRERYDALIEGGIGPDDALDDARSW